MNMLLVAMILLQEKTVEQTFKKIEETLERATSVQVKFRVEGKATQGERRTTYMGTGFLALRGKDCFHLTCSSKQTSGGKDDLDDVRIVSDGKQMFFSSGERKWIWEASNDFSIARFKGNLLRLGAWRTAWLADTYGVLATEAIGMSDFREGPKSDRGSTLKFATKYRTERFSDEVHQSETLLEYEAETFKLLGRRVVFGADASMNETYEAFTLNADIPDRMFKLPKDGK